MEQATIGPARPDGRPHKATSIFNAGLAPKESRERKSAVFRPSNHETSRTCLCTALHILIKLVPTNGAITAMEIDSTLYLNSQDVLERRDEHLPVIFVSRILTTKNEISNE